LHYADAISSGQQGAAVGDADMELLTDLLEQFAKTRLLNQ